MKKTILPPADAYRYPYRGYQSSETNNYYKELKVNKTSWRNLRKKLLQRQNFKCAYCLIDLHGRRMNIEHVLPVRRGGGNDLNNLVASCAECNKKKQNRILKKHELTELHERLKLLKKESAREARQLSLYKDDQFIKSIGWILEDQ